MPPELLSKALKRQIKLQKFKELFFYSLPALEDYYGAFNARLPFCLRHLLEAVLRNQDNKIFNEKHIEKITNWKGKVGLNEIPFLPARIILQDLTGVPSLLDLAALKEAVQDQGFSAELVEPIIPTTLVIDHSVQVDYSRIPNALEKNENLEFARNSERYRFLKWAQKAFNNLKIIPPATGIIHQVNLEYLSQLIFINKDKKLVYPDSCLGTDSHTPMINGLGVIGWGVGGIEIEAAMLGQPIFFLLPEVIGVKLTGELSHGICATDLVLTITELFRQRNLVGKFVEFFGSGVETLSVADRATISNMAPEQGSTMSFFPVDKKTIEFLKETGRNDETILLAESYFKEQGLFYDPDSIKPDYSEVFEIDLSQIELSVAGPKKPHQRQKLNELKGNFKKILNTISSYEGDGFNNKQSGDKINLFEGEELKDGSVVIASITSCTTTSNPTLLITAGLVAQKAIEKGLKIKRYVKTSFAPGSKVTSEYLRELGLLDYLEKLGFGVVGYGCMTCIGNSGPLEREVEEEIKKKDLMVAAVLSGNRNFEGRIHPLTKVNYLVSPALVVLYAIAGTLDIDLTKDPLGKDKQGKDIFLKDLWPMDTEINKLVSQALKPELFKKQYSFVFEGSKAWAQIETITSDRYPWDDKSTYLVKPPFCNNILRGGNPKNLKNARVLGVFGDFITTDHISPAGKISENSAAGEYLITKGVKPEDFNSYGSRRGNHEVMLRGTFDNKRLCNLLIEGREGNFTKHFPTEKEMSFFKASEKYLEENVPLIIFAGKEYGSGSSRDWAAKGPLLLGVKAVIAQSFERIHRSNLISVGILPLEFFKGENRQLYGIKGDELFDIELGEKLIPKQRVRVTMKKANNIVKSFELICRLDLPIEVEYYLTGGTLPYIFNKLINS